MSILLATTIVGMPLQFSCSSSYQVSRFLYVTYMETIPLQENSLWPCLTSIWSKTSCLGTMQILSDGGSYLSCYIKHHDACMSSVIVWCMHTVEALLSSSVPDIWWWVWLSSHIMHNKRLHPLVVQLFGQLQGQLLTNWYSLAILILIVIAI